MASPNVSEIATVAIESRTGEIRDNVKKNNALLTWLDRKGNIVEFSGGTQINEELSYQENGNFLFYSGYDQLSVSAQDTFSSATFAIKQAAVAVLMSGLEEMQNSGKERVVPLLASRIKNAEGTFANQLSSSIYGDGTTYGGKSVTGLALAVSNTPSVGSYGGIDPANFSFWRNYVNASGALNSATIQAAMNKVWVNLVRGMDHPELILADNNLFTLYLQSLQALQRFTQAEKGELGFPALKFMSEDVILDGGIGGFCPANTMYFLNPKYIFWRPFVDRNMVPLDPRRRVSINQDAHVNIIAWAGNLTCAGRKFQGVLNAN